MKQLSQNQHLKKNILSILCWKHWSCLTGCQRSLPSFFKRSNLGQISDAAHIVVLFHVMFECCNLYILHTSKVVLWMIPQQHLVRSTSVPTCNLRIFGCSASSLMGRGFSLVVAYRSLIAAVSLVAGHRL